MIEPTVRKLQRGNHEKDLQLGDLAPGFTLRRTFEESVSLSDLTATGGVVLAFYVFDFGHV